MRLGGVVLCNYSLQQRYRFPIWEYHRSHYWPLPSEFSPIKSIFGKFRSLVGPLAALTKIARQVHRYFQCMTRYYSDVIMKRVYWYITHWIDRRENIYAPNFILGQIHSWAIKFRGARRSGQFVLCETRFLRSKQTIHATSQKAASYTRLHFHLTGGSISSLRHHDSL